MRILLDAQRMDEKETAHDYLAAELDFPDYYGRNLDALYECLCELPDGEIAILHAKTAGDYYLKVEKVLKKAAQDNKGLHICLLGESDGDCVNIVECSPERCYNERQEAGNGTGCEADGTDGHKKETEEMVMLEFKYDTQLLIEGEDLDEDEISEYFTENFKGDCLLAVGDEELIKIHFHTNEPWKVLEYCASIGEIYDIVVEDMDRQSRGLKG